MHPDAVARWQAALRRFGTTRYRQNGVRAVDRLQEALSCRVRHIGFDYRAEGVFVPNNLSPDSNANRRLDILRCKLSASHSRAAYLRFRANAFHTDPALEDLTVEILRGELTLTRFTIPWSTRGVGYMLDSSAEGGGGGGGRGGTTSTLPSTHLDPWAGVAADVSGDGIEPRWTWKQEPIYLCVSGSAVLPSKEMAPYYLEFIQHHLLMGVSHIFLGVAFAWQSSNMRRLLELLGSFIEEGRLTVQSHSGDGLDFVFSLAGISIERDNLKNYHVNACTYFAKGMADYVAVWDLDEYFIPRGANRDLLDLVESLDTYRRHTRPWQQSYAAVHGQRSLLERYLAGWQGGRGMADGDAHPLCFIQLDSEVVLYPDEYNADLPDLDRFTWMGDRFPFGE